MSTGFMPFERGDRVRHDLSGEVGHVDGEPTMTLYGSKVDVRNERTGVLWPAFVDELTAEPG